MGDVQALADRMTILLNDESLRKQMGEAALQHALKNFTKEQIVPIYEAAYEKAMNS